MPSSRAKQLATQFLDENIATFDGAINTVTSSSIEHFHRPLVQLWSELDSDPHLARAIARELASANRGFRKELTIAMQRIASSIPTMHTFDPRVRAGICAGLCDVYVRDIDRIHGDTLDNETAPWAQSIRTTRAEITTLADQLVRWTPHRIQCFNGETYPPLITMATTDIQPSRPTVISHRIGTSIAKAPQRRPTDANLVWTVGVPSHRFASADAVRQIRDQAPNTWAHSRIQVDEFADLETVAVALTDSTSQARPGATLTISDPVVAILLHGFARRREIGRNIVIRGAVFSPIGLAELLRDADLPHDLPKAWPDTVSWFNATIGTWLDDRFTRFGLSDNDKLWPLNGSGGGQPLVAPENLSFGFARSLLTADDDLTTRCRTFVEIATPGFAKPERWQVPELADRLAAGAQQACFPSDTYADLEWRSAVLATIARAEGTNPAAATANLIEFVTRGIGAEQLRPAAAAITAFTAPNQVPERLRRSRT